MADSIGKAKDSEVEIIAPREASHPSCNMDTNASPPPNDSSCLAPPTRESDHNSAGPNDVSGKSDGPKLPQEKLENNLETEKLEMSDVAASAAAAPAAQESPWPFLDEFVKFVGGNKTSYTFQCRLCLPSYKTLTTSIASRGNIRQHIQL